MPYVRQVILTDIVSILVIPVIYLYEVKAIYGVTTPYVGTAIEVYTGLVDDTRLTMVVPNIRTSFLDDIFLVFEEGTVSYQMIGNHRVSQDRLRVPFSIHKDELVWNGIQIIIRIALGSNNMTGVR